MPVLDERADVLVVHAYGEIDAIDVETSRRALFTPSAQLTTTLQTAADVVAFAWWSPSRDRLVIRTQHALRTVAPDGSIETLRDGLPEPLGDCTWLDATSQVACAERGDFGPDNLARVLIEGATPVEHAWQSRIRGTMRVLPDASGVVFADHCTPDGTDSECVFFAALDGSGRRGLTHAAGEVCVIAPSDDGRHVALAYGAEGSACSRIATVDVADGATREVYALGRPEDVSERVGARFVAMARDASRIALLSDERLGCHGSYVTVCNLTPTTLRADGSDVARPTGEPMMDGLLVWRR